VGGRWAVWVAVDRRRRQRREGRMTAPAGEALEYLICWEGRVGDARVRRLRRADDMTATTHG